MLAKCHTLLQGFSKCGSQPTGDLRVGTTCLLLEHFGSNLEPFWKEGYWPKDATSWNDLSAASGGLSQLAPGQWLTLWVSERPTEASGSYIQFSETIEWVAGWHTWKRPLRAPEKSFWPAALQSIMENEVGCSTQQVRKWCLYSFHLLFGKEEFWTPEYLYFNKQGWTVPKYVPATWKVMACSSPPHNSCFWSHDILKFVPPCLTPLAANDRLAGQCRWSWHHDLKVIV